MSIYPKIARNIILPLADIAANTKISKNLKFLEKSQWWSREELLKYQNKKLRALIKHVYENVPYYHSEWKKLNLKPEDIKTVEDLRKIPIITKGDIRGNFEDFKSKDFAVRKPKSGSTSGSTGEPLRYFYDWDAWSMDWACTYRGWSFSGYKIGDKIITLGGSSLVPTDKIPFKKKIKNRLIDRNIALSSYDMDEQSMVEYIKLMNRYKPKFLFGYPTAIYVFANFVNKNNIAPLLLKGIFTTSEKLFDPHRNFIKEVFDTDVFEGYGCRDGGANAMECSQHSGLHYSMERSVMEFIRDGENVIGEEGEIVLTDLHNYAFPFIRYEVEDVGILSDEKCSCGRKLPLIREILGRTRDFIVTPSGKLIHGGFFSHILLDKIEGVKQYQVLQEKTNELIIKIIPDSDFKDDSIQKIENIVRLRMGNVNVKVVLTDKIPIPESGKWHQVISKVSKQYFRVRNGKKSER